MADQADFASKYSIDLCAYRDLLATLPSDLPGASNLRDGIACSELALVFHTEANRAVQAEIWFAAAALAAAALESMLLAKMFMNAEEVVKLPTFRKLLDKHNGDIGSFARKMDLGNLVEMAKQLGWFRPGGVPSLLTDMLSKHVGMTTLMALTAFFKHSQSAGYEAADLLRQYRNLLHPASCLKQEAQPTKETGMRATYFSLVAFASLA